MGKSRKSAGVRYPADLTAMLRRNQPYKDKVVLKEVLGSGALSTVRRAVDKKDNKRVLAAKIEQKQALSADMRRAESFVKEIDALTSLCHANIVEWHGIQENDRDLALITEFAPMGDLASVGSLLPKECSAVATQLMEALAYMHRQSFVHGDIKPQNMLMVSKEPVSIRLTDFGTSTRLAFETGCGMACCREEAGEGQEPGFSKGRRGTMQYMAPEVLFEDRCCHASDVWSAGIVCKRLPIGKLPFTVEENEDMIPVVEALCDRTEIVPESVFSKLPVLGAMLGRSTDNVVRASTPLERAIFQKDPAHRPCADAILAHPDWLLFGCAGEESEEAKIDKATFKKLKMGITRKLRDGEELSAEEEALCVMHDL